MVFLLKYYFVVIQVDGESMQPTIRDKHFVVVLKNLKSYDKDDIIVFEKNGLQIKRIVVVGVSEIRCEYGKVYCNGFCIEPYSTCEDVKYVLDENDYFVIGDNYNNSIDSRVYGPVEYSDIVGKVILIL